MNLAPAFLLCLSLSNFSFAQETKGPITSAKNPSGSHEVITAKVESVFKMVDEAGFQFTAYQIKFNGKNVIVEDPICSTNANEGDDIKVIVVRNDLSRTTKDGKKVISFIVAKSKA